ncbi:hypothetical protein HHI36_021759 [Cryptolaemus montrouzieri]|uniref:Protein quiver n=1 Tax=Cryptolaemus montrouzieri TaxID=559131 RepID=A0ABD2MXT6_9CUCU
MVRSEFLLLAVIWIIFSDVPPSTAIRCYKCSLTKTNLYLTETTGLCSEFDYSERFIVDCPESTFCVKKIYQANIAGFLNGTDRFCAFQKYETHKVVNGVWEPRVIIEEPYTENCTVINDHGLKTVWTEECYCKTDLCNGEIHFRDATRYDASIRHQESTQHNGSAGYPEARSPLLLLSTVIILIHIPLIG